MTKVIPPFASAAVEAAFAAFPKRQRSALLRLRREIFACADATDGVGPIEETLKWGQPAYVPLQSRSGTTLRLGVPRTGGIALWVPCQTTVISDARAVFPTEFDYEGNRGVHFPETGPEHMGPVRALIAAALTYHARKRH